MPGRRGCLAARRPGSARKLSPSTTRAAPPCPRNWPAARRGRAAINALRPPGLPRGVLKPFSPFEPLQPLRRASLTASAERGRRHARSTRLDGRERRSPRRTASRRAGPGHSILPRDGVHLGARRRRPLRAAVALARGRHLFLLFLRSRLVTVDAFGFCAAWRVSPWLFAVPALTCFATPRRASSASLP